MSQQYTIKDALNLGLEFQQKGDLQQAQEIYLQILKQDEENPDALHLLGVIDFKLKEYLQASRYIERAIKQKPNEAPFHNNLGLCLQKLPKELDNAIKHYKKSIELNPNYEKAHYNLSSAYIEKNQLEKAKRQLVEVIKLNPHNAEANNNLGIIYKEESNNEQALKHYNRAIELKPDYADAHFNKALVLLTQKDLKQGFKEYEYRFKKTNPVEKRNFTKPRWNGKNKTVLITYEQGFGDFFCFLRYIPLIKSKVIIECPRDIMPLLKTYQTIEKSNNLPDIEYDEYCPIMSLPNVFKTTQKSIPNKTPYITPNPKKLKFWKEKIHGNYKIGICWSGNPEQVKNKDRSTTEEQFSKLKSDKVMLYSLQKDQKANHSINLDIKDFADTAAIIANLDLIITVDTSVAHLAGAMNKPTWVLLSTNPDWRYSDINSWYPSIKTFKQKEQGNWNQVFEDIKKELGPVV